MEYLNNDKHNRDPDKTCSSIRSNIQQDDYNFDDSLELESSQKAHNELYDRAALAYHITDNLRFSDEFEEAYLYLGQYIYDATRQTIGITRLLCCIFCLGYGLSLIFLHSQLYNSICALIIQLLYSYLIICRNYFIFSNQKNIRRNLKERKEIDSIDFNLGHDSNLSNHTVIHDNQYPSNLPKYSILLPLLKEANIVQQLVRNIKALQYPQDKLQVLLVLEKDDEDTRKEVKKLSGLGLLPPNFHIILVPTFEPRTKAKASNYALHYVTGDYLAIFDSEDQPEPDQLLKAAHRFMNNPSLRCLQAPLNYYNRQTNFLTRMFSIEYHILFCKILPSFQLKNIPIPLGGSSSHFCTKTLKFMKGWDICNVTEDAEIGLRLALAGYEVEILDSQTLEESPLLLKQWLKQRARWIKGHLKTYVHYVLSLSHQDSSLYNNSAICLNPNSHLKSERLLSLLPRAGIHFIIGIPYIAMLLTPLSFMYLALTWLGVNIFASSYSGLITVLSYTNAATYLSSILWQAKLASNEMDRKYYKNSREKELNPSAYKAINWCLFPFYHVLHIVAAFMAIYQLITKPFYWDKTEHGLWKNSMEE